MYVLSFIKNKYFNERTFKTTFPDINIFMVRQASSANGFGLSIRRGKSFMEMII